MKRIIVFLFVGILFVSCSEYQKLLKSDDAKLKYEKALELYEEGEYLKAITLFEQVIPIYKGTKDEEKIFYLYAQANYKAGDYIIAGYYFRNFAKSYPNSEYAQDAFYMSAYCYYLDSPPYNLDQTNTVKAIGEFQLFISRYPESDKVADANKYIEKLGDKLAKKSFYNSKLYFDLRQYEAAITAFENTLKGYPNSNYREDCLFYILQSHFLYAENSIRKKQSERYQKAVKAYKLYILEYPNGEYIKDAKKMHEKSLEALENRKEDITAKK